VGLALGTAEGRIPGATDRKYRSLIKTDIHDDNPYRNPVIQC